MGLLIIFTTSIYHSVSITNGFPKRLKNQRKFKELLQVEGNSDDIKYFKKSLELDEQKKVIKLT